MGDDNFLKIIERDLVEEPLITPVSPAINVTWADSVQVKIVDSEKISTKKNLPLKENTSYLVETRVINPLFSHLPSHSLVWRKEEEFENFRHFLASTYPYIILPPLISAKKHSFFPFFKKVLPSDLLDDHPPEKIGKELENFLIQIKGHPTLSEEKELLNFLTKDAEWTAPMFITSSPQFKPGKTFWQLSKIKHPDKKIDALKNYTIEFQKTVGHLVKTNEELVVKKIEMLQDFHSISHHLHSIKLDNPSLNNACLNAANYLDSFVAYSRTGLGDDTALIKVLKDQFHYAFSVLEVCHNQETLQAKLEKNEEQLTAKLKQKQETPLALMALPTWSSLLGNLVPVTLSSSEKFLPFLDRLMGRDSSLTAQDSRMTQLNECIKELEKNSNIIKEEKEKFMELASKDIEHFQIQKTQDIKDALMKDVHHQVLLNKNNAMAWLSIKQTLEGL